MITLQIPKQKTTEIQKGVTTLYEAIHKDDSMGLDITDQEGGWDMEAYLGCEKSWEATQDSYDRLMLLFACNIKVEGYHPDWDTQCYIADFLWENRRVFEKFFNKHNANEYRPIYFQRELQRRGKDLSPDEDTGFYESFIKPFISLVEGYYSPDDYEELFRDLCKEALIVF
jgi:hypothetical protein